MAAWGDMPHPQVPSLWEPGSQPPGDDLIIHFPSCGHARKVGKQVFSGRWMTSAAKQISLLCLFDSLMACQSGQHESDPRPQGASMDA